MPDTTPLSSCLFCRIVAGVIPATRVAENAHGIAFDDIDPKAPVHVLVIPKRHVSSLPDADDMVELAALLGLARDVAERKGVATAGYRVVTNIGEDGGQSVSHLHFHVLGGRAMGWPPG